MEFKKLLVARKLAERKMRTGPARDARSGDIRTLVVAVVLEADIRTYQLSNHSEKAALRLACTSSRRGEYALPGFGEPLSDEKLKNEAL
jgi:hypothetical protein